MPTFLAFWQTAGILSTLLALTMEVFVVVLSISRRMKGPTQTRAFSFEVFTYSWSTSHLVRRNEIVSFSNLRNSPILRYCLTKISKIYFRGLKYAPPPPVHFLWPCHSLFSFRLQQVVRTNAEEFFLNLTCFSFAGLKVKKILLFLDGTVQYSTEIAM